MTISEPYASVWDAIADTPGEAANMQAKCELMRKIVVIIQSKSWTQSEAATHCAVTQPRMNDLLRGRISRFSLDALVNIAAAIGQRVHIELDGAA
jgi:predicted XRE-type DNA-binding protein